MQKALVCMGGKWTNRPELISVSLAMKEYFCFFLDGMLVHRILDSSHNNYILVQYKMREEGVSVAESLTGSNCPY